ncbi:MAG TPA: glucosaminidase domain-containing protein [Roseiflexaceae bacterium]|nr:glucosaminidase domain-containing protein [Roseiflexaceae bacterium]HMP39472.1 glucosaminidase domain-containing protein [Roseiflexaceae bacterium]
MSGTERPKNRPDDPAPPHREAARRQLAERKQNKLTITPAPNLLGKQRVSLDDVIKQERQILRRSTAEVPAATLPSAASPRATRSLHVQPKSASMPDGEPQRRRAYQPPTPAEIVSDDDYDDMLATRPISHRRADTARLDALLSRTYDTYDPPGYVGSRRTLLEQINDHPWLLIPIAAASLVIILFAFGGDGGSILSRYMPPPPEPQIQVIGAPSVPVSAPISIPTGEHSVLGAPTISADAINAVLADYGSPAHGTGQIWIDLGRQYGIDPAYALAFFIHESSAGTNPGWAGLKPDGSSTHNVGNIICAGYPTCYGRFRDYPGWTEGIQDWYKLISVEYINGRGVHTVEQIIPIYAPSFENNVPAYVNAVNTMVYTWRAQRGMP